MYVLPHMELTKVRASTPYIILKGDSDLKRRFFQTLHFRRWKYCDAGGVASLRPVLLEFYHATRASRLLPRDPRFHNVTTRPRASRILPRDLASAFCKDPN